MMGLGKVVSDVGLGARAMVTGEVWVGSDWAVCKRKAMAT